MAKKNVVLGVTGSIAAYKAADIVRRLQDAGCDVTVLMTASAEKFITALTLETLSHHPVYRDMFSREGAWDIAHISAAKLADVLLIAPATADIIAKVAHGFADDVVSCTAVTTKAPIVIAPAMNSDMFSNPAVQENIATLRKRGVVFVEPKKGKLACGDEGKGALAGIDLIVEKTTALLAR